jgi:hypothetical protein
MGCAALRNGTTRENMFAKDQRAGYISEAAHIILRTSPREFKAHLRRTLMALIPGSAPSDFDVGLRHV